MEECKSGKLDGIVAIYRTFASAQMTGLVDEELVQALPKSVKFICHNGQFLEKRQHCVAVRHPQNVRNGTTSSIMSGRSLLKVCRSLRPGCS